MAPRGRKTISETGERMKTRPVRMPDDLWAAVLAWGGSEMVREACAREIARRLSKKPTAPGRKRAETAVLKLDKSAAKPRRS